MTLTRRLAAAAAPLDPLADAVRSAVQALPKPVRNLLDGAWLGAPLHPALTDVPLGSWTAAMVLDAVAPASGDDSVVRAADQALAVRILAGPAVFPQPRYESRVQQDRVELRRSE